MKKRRDLRLLWNSNAPFSNSGYGTFTRDLVYRMVADGWPVAMSSFYGVQGGWVDTLYPDHLNPRLKGLKLKNYPTMGDVFGSDALANHAVNWGAHVAFSMQDVWPLDPQYLSNIKMWIPYVPIDKDPVPLNVQDKLRYANRIITFAKFGQEALEKVGFTSTLIVEGTDTDIFKPMDQAAVRKEMGIPADKFIFGMVAANKENPPRKSFQEAIEAFKLFHDVHPEAALFFHVQQRSPGGFPIKEYAQQLGVGDDTFFIDDYTAMYNSDSGLIAKEYNMFDVLLHPSQTEGFGLCIIEAQATGTPVIVQDCQSMPELIIEGKTGWAAKTATRRVANDVSMVHVPDVQSIYEQMEKAYTAIQENPYEVAKDCRENVLKNYSIDMLFDTKWRPYLESLQEEILGPLQVREPRVKST